NEPRVVAGRSIERAGRDWGQTGMHLAAFSRQHALMEPSVAGSQYRSAIPAEFCSDAQAWRNQIPGIERAKAADDFSCFIPSQVDRAEILTDSAAVVEPEAGIDGQPISDRDRVGRE